MAPKAGTKPFIEFLKRRKFAKCQDVIEARGHEVAELVEKTQFRRPLFVATPEGLGMRLPPGSFTIRDVVEAVGPTHVIDVIDVQKQHDFKMSLAEFFNWFYQEDRGDKIYNVLSLEFSDTPLSALVQPPKVVRDLSLVNKVWPEVGGRANARPEVLKFCLMSAGSSYTDFHVDFGGSSVWYHILWGEKVFYIVPPTEENLEKYEAWMESADNLTTFLGDVCEVYELRVGTGNTIMLPAGWIHAVYTPCDSLVFGGNFIHLHSVKMQIKIYEMEQRLATEKRFQFPMFEKLHWYAAQLFYEQYRGDLEEQALPELSHLDSVQYLVQSLGLWYEKRKGSPYQGQYVPDTLAVPPRILLRDFEKLLRHFLRRHDRRREAEAKEAGAKQAGGIKLKIKRQPEGKGRRRIVKHVIERIGDAEGETERLLFGDGERPQPQPQPQSQPLRAAVDNSSASGLKRRRPKAAATDAAAADDAGIDVSKCTEDADFYYPPVGPEDSDDDDADYEDEKKKMKARAEDSWKPVANDVACRTRSSGAQSAAGHSSPTPAAIAGSGRQSSSSATRAKPASRRCVPQSAQSTARQRLGKKLGLLRCGR